MNIISTRTLGLGQVFKLRSERQVLLTEGKGMEMGVTVETQEEEPW